MRHFNSFSREEYFKAGLEFFGSTLAFNLLTVHFNANSLHTEGGGLLEGCLGVGWVLERENALKWLRRGRVLYVGKN